VKLTYSHEEDWPGGVDPKDGKYWKKGVYTVWNSVHRESLDWKDFTFKDFPKTQDELEERLGVDRVKAFARSTSTDIDGGAIVAGGRDDPQNGSIVALQNRLVVVLQGPLGPYMVTNDVARTSGLKDYSNSLIFAGKPFERGSGARAVRDAGEILFYLPNGGQGGILVNGQGDRVELAAQTIAQETTDKSMNIGVRTYGSCATCHAGGGGYVPPKDLYASWKAMGIKHKFYDPAQANRVEGSSAILMKDCCLRESVTRSWQPIRQPCVPRNLLSQRRGLEQMWPSPWVISVLPTITQSTSILPLGSAVCRRRRQHGYSSE
jgi:hypothetical protein